MSSVVSGDEFDRLMSETLAVLGPAGAAPGGGSGGPVEVRGEGLGLDGLVRVVVAPGGRVESVVVDPRAMRSDSFSLAEGFAKATNAALDDLRAQLAVTVPGLPDRQTLTERLREVQNTSTRRMEVFLQALQQAQQRTGRD